MDLQFSRSRTWLGLVTASVIFAAGCDGDADPSSGPPIVEQPTEKITATFGDAETDPFQKGASPLSAVFEGGTASGNGAWIIPENETGEITFTTPTRSLTIEFANDYQPPEPGLNKSGSQRVMQQVDVECGVSDQGNNNSEAYNALMYLRGFTQVDDPATSASDPSRFLATPDNVFVNFGNNIYQTEIVMSPDNIVEGPFRYKIAAERREV